MSARLERALADLVGGYDGGLSLWEIACGKLARTAENARDEHRFRSHPPGALRRLLVDIEDTLRVATLAVEIQVTLDGEADTAGLDDRGEQIAELLLARARELADQRTSGPPPSTKTRRNSRRRGTNAAADFGTRTVNR